MTLSIPQLHKQLYYYQTLDSDFQPQLFLSLHEIADAEKRAEIYRETLAALKLDIANPHPHHLVIPIPAARRQETLSMLAQVLKGRDSTTPLDKAQIGEMDMPPEQPPTQSAPTASGTGLHPELYYYLKPNAIFGSKLYISLSELEEDARAQCFRETVERLNLPSTTTDMHHLLIQVPPSYHGAVLRELNTHLPGHNTTSFEDLDDIAALHAKGIGRNLKRTYISPSAFEQDASAPQLAARDLLNILCMPLFESTGQDRLPHNKTPESAAAHLIYLQQAIALLIAPHPKRQKEPVFERPLTQEELTQEFRGCSPAELIQKVQAHLKELFTAIPSEIKVTSTPATVAGCVNLRVSRQPQKSAAEEKIRAEALSDLVGWLLTGERKPFYEVHNNKLRVPTATLPEQLQTVLMTKSQRSL